METKTLADLKCIAKELGLKKYSSLRKSELIDLIHQNEKFYKNCMGTPIDKVKKTAKLLSVKGTKPEICDNLSELVSDIGVCNKPRKNNASKKLIEKEVSFKELTSLEVPSVKPTEIKNITISKKPTIKRLRAKPLENKSQSPRSIEQSPRSIEQEKVISNSLALPEYKIPSIASNLTSRSQCMKLSKPQLMKISKIMGISTTGKTKENLCSDILKKTQYFPDDEDLESIVNPQRSLKSESLFDKLPLKISVESPKEKNLQIIPSRNLTPNLINPTNILSQKSIEDIITDGVQDNIIAQNIIVSIDEKIDETDSSEKEAAIEVVQNAGEDGIIPKTVAAEIVTELATDKLPKFGASGFGASGFETEIVDTFVAPEVIPITTKSFKRRPKNVSVPPPDTLNVVTKAPVKKRVVFSPAVVSEEVVFPVRDIKNMDNVQDLIRELKNPEARIRDLGSISQQLSAMFKLS